MDARRAGTAIFLVLLCGSAPAALNAQAPERTLTGFVVDAATGTPISGAAVRLAPAQRVALTSPTGEFRFADPPAGFVTLSVEAFGYQPFGLTLDPEDVQESLRILLDPDPLLLDGLDVDVGNDGRVAGRVFDARNGQSLAGVAVRVAFNGPRVPTLTDPDGAFEIDRVRPGRRLIELRHLGYVPVLIPVVATSNPGALDIPLAWDSVASARVQEEEDRLRAERRAVANMSVRTIDRDQIASRRWLDSRDLLHRAGVWLEACPTESNAASCARTGRVVAPIYLCIDGREATGGVYQLDTYHPAEIHLVEVFGRGAMVRVTTVTHLEDLAASGRRRPETCKDPRIG